MKLRLNPSITFENLQTTLQERLPHCKVELKKNPIAGFRYIQVYKSAYVGVWIRIFESKEEVALIKTIPSTIARVLAGGVLAWLIASSAQSKLRTEVAEIIKGAFNTSEN